MGLACCGNLLEDVMTDSVNSTGGGQGSGNAELAASFDKAKAEAAETLKISVEGQAQLNALRARPQ
jgi:hypothetical protein